MNTIDQSIKQWLLLQPLTPENQKRLDEKFRLEFNYNSNHLEGNTLTYGETKLLLLFDQTKGNHELREYEEMQAHDVALKMVKEEAADIERPLTEGFIRQLNETILVRPFWKDAQTHDGQATRRLIKVGEYKEYPNSVRQENGEIFEYASPQETPAMMTELIQWYNEETHKKEYTPIELAALLHYKYIRIHPFDDGNGRIARLLVNYVLFRNNLPPVIIKTADKKNYLRALQRADAGFLNDFVDYMKEQLWWSLDIAIKAAKGESIEEPNDLDKKVHLLKKELGEAPEDEVKIKYSQEAFRQVLEYSFFPLIMAWEERLKSFDPLFLDRNIEASCHFKNLPSLTHPIDIETFQELMSKVREEGQVFKDIYKYKNIKISSTFKGLKQTNKTSLDGGTIAIEFYTNAYEVSYSNGKKPINKLYHQALDEEDINTIVLALGNFLFANIEEARVSNYK